MQRSPRLLQVSITVPRLGSDRQQPLHSRHYSLRHERQERVDNTYSLAKIANFQILGDSLLRRYCC